MVLRINSKKLDTEATLTTKQVAELTGYSSKTIQRYAKEELLHSFGSNRKRLFHGTEVARFMGLLADKANASLFVN